VLTCLLCAYWSEGLLFLKKANLLILLVGAVGLEPTTR
jgi:hypothetical protein